MSGAFLGVEHSLGGRRWQERPADLRLALTICQRHELPDIVGQVLASREISLDEAAHFLKPTLRDLLPDPFHLKDMDKAADRLAVAVMNGQIIGVFGDYDVDGATSAALLLRFFAALGAATAFHIPDRMTEGYGPNTPALLRMRQAGVAVAVTVDCGIAAFAPLAAAAAAGLDVIVVDHHEAEEALPVALAVVNPNRLDETSAHGHLAAVGVAFLLVVAVQSRLRERGWFKDHAAPDLLRWLDIVALGTVCDVVPLVGANRALVAQGLKVLGMRRNAGIAALCDLAGLKEPADSYHLGYILGPRVNAGGRVGQADLGVRLLTTDDPQEAAVLAHCLEGHNRARQEIEAAVLQSAIEQVDRFSDDRLPLVLAAGDGWHPGVIGIVAGRLKERYNRPACVIAFEGDEGKGSGRSVSGFDLGAVIIAARQAGLLLKGGGHAMAAGFSLTREQLDGFRGFLGERLAAQMQGPLRPVFELDGALDPGGGTLDLVKSLLCLGPFGSGNGEPRFAVTGALVKSARVVGAGHVSCILSGRSGGRLKAIAFRAADTDLGRALLAKDGTPMHLAGPLRIDNWQGNSTVQLFIEDGAPSV